jgi:hypothetical protein
MSSGIIFIYQNDGDVEPRSNHCGQLDCTEYNPNYQYPDENDPLCLELAIETDYELFNHFGNISGTDVSQLDDEEKRVLGIQFTAWLETEFVNPVSDFYDSYGLDIKLVFVNIYTDSNDPYSNLGDSPNDDAITNAFRDEWSRGSNADKYADIDRDMTIFITGRDIAGVNG